MKKEKQAIAVEDSAEDSWISLKSHIPEYVEWVSKNKDYVLNLLEEAEAKEKLEKKEKKE